MNNIINFNPNKLNVGYKMEHLCERNLSDLIQYDSMMQCWTIVSDDGITIATYIKYCPFCGEKLEDMR